MTKRKSSVIFSAIVFSLMILFLRMYITDTRYFLFLTWNLLLAAIPLFITSFILYFNIENKLLLLGVFLMWLLFLPNAPYILTDLLHVKSRNIIPIWYDFIMIFSFALTGLFMTLESIIHFEKIAQKYISENALRVTTVLIFFLSSFGIYIGRFMRWNSWDIFYNFETIFLQLFDILLHPLENKEIWLFTIFYGIFLNMVMVISRKFVLV